MDDRLSGFCLGCWRNSMTTGFEWMIDSVWAAGEMAGQLDFSG